MKVVIPFAQVHANNPNLNVNARDSALETYFHCIVVAFASLRRWNPNLTLQLTTNLPISQHYVDLLNGFRVNIRIIDFSFNPPKQFGDMFRGCFYLFDAIAAEEDDVLYIDPDVYCIKQLPKDIFLTQHIGAICLNFPDNKNINGLTPRKAREIYVEMMSHPVIVNHVHYGGEAIFVPKNLHRKLISEIQQIWKKNIAAAISGKPFFTTEEHILSLVLRNYKVMNLNSVILRIWTTIKYYRVEGGKPNSERLSLWHLPAEKSYGFKTAYDLLLKNKLYQDISVSKQLSKEQRIFHIRSRYKKLFHRMRSISR